MKLTFFFPAFPPALDGIGDHTARLAAALSRHCEVTVLTTQSDAETVPGVDVRVLPPIDTRGGQQALIQAIQTHPPDWLFVQFNQFSYGRWGFNPRFPLTIKHLRQTVSDMRIAVFFHEDFVPISSWKFAVMTTWQRWQFWMLGRQAEHVFFSIEPWVAKYRSWFPDAVVTALPVGSNMPDPTITYRDARRELGIASDQFVAGIFGTIGPSRPLRHIRAATDALSDRDPNLLVLYVGPHGPDLRAALGNVALHDAGPLPGPDVSRHLAAMDIHLSPFADGMSSRRGSCLAGLQHGVATISTGGVHTELVFLDARGRALALTPVDAPDAFAREALRLWDDPTYRHRLGRAGRELYQSRCDWSVIADRLVSALGTSALAPAPVA